MPYSHTTRARHVRPLLFLAAAALSLPACNFFEDPNFVEAEPGVLLQRVRGGNNGNGQGNGNGQNQGGESSEDGETYVGLDFVTTGPDGQPVGCSESDPEVAIELSFEGPDSGFEAVDTSTIAACGQTGAADVVLVVDNSGSQESVLQRTEESARSFAAQVLAAGGRVGIVRVSTHSRVLTELTDDQAIIDAAIDQLFVENGWTSLYDGIRMGNEVLGRALGTAAAEAHEDLDDFCQARRPFAVVAFTDGRDNNSSDEELATPESDGIDTTLNELFDLNIDGIRTPVYTVGLGLEPDHEKLTQLAQATGGTHLESFGEGALNISLGAIAEYPYATHRVCAQTSRKGCGVAWARVFYGGNGASDSFYEDGEVREVHIPCPHAAPAGRSVGILLKLSHPSIERATAARIARNAVSWATPVFSPRVLVVRDRAHNEHYADDPLFITELLEEGGFDVTFINEPNGGLSNGILKDYDVVWFSNPDQPLSRKNTLLSLLKFAGDGGGVILSGDDMTYSRFQSFPMTNLLHLEHESKGAYTCEQYTDRDEGGQWQVSLNATDHPVLAGVSQTSFAYGYSLDHATALDRGEEVLASATFTDGTCEKTVPVIVAFSAN
ncbi:VWA domain-containing protein [Lujinxingia vulgaris]|uniref:VWA domain-containing protein n=1 Tax=Lujinxingia vulgaris TaxID=2600176 RepID=A0A5C6X672_9DELT|nr:VWA domain-containing protein [Lujinxingia vulgaris]TXD37300.1 VWA domain-containing protein [Lujinxingia vulgaris]